MGSEAGMTQGRREVQCPGLPGRLPRLCKAWQGPSTNASCTHILCIPGQALPWNSCCGQHAHKRRVGSQHSHWFWSVTLLQLDNREARHHSRHPYTMCEATVHRTEQHGLEDGHRDPWPSTGSPRWAGHILRRALTEVPRQFNGERDNRTSAWKKSHRTAK